MNKILKVKSLSIWIFLIPFIAVNACLIVSTHYTELFKDGQAIYNQPFPELFPYIDGGASISRTARYFPTYLIFKPAMFLTSYLLIKYWLYNKEIVLSLGKNTKYIKKFVFFGISSAVCLILHSIFLGVKFDYDLYKLFRRVIMLSFVIFEIVAQTYLVLTFYSMKNYINDFINPNILKIKIFLVTTLIVVALISIPIIGLPGNKSIKHALEWDYFLGVISFYLLTFLMWKKK